MYQLSVNKRAVNIIYLSQVQTLRDLRIESCLSLET